jgi:hypothetical protein
MDLKSSLFKRGEMARLLSKVFFPPTEKMFSTNFSRKTLYVKPFWEEFERERERKIRRKERERNGFNEA